MVCKLGKANLYFNASSDLRSILKRRHGSNPVYPVSLS